jgi:uncharacterized protein (TIGR01370 family)
MTSIPIDIKNQETLFICYGKLNPKSVVGYKYVILESSFYTSVEIQQFKENNETIFAYLSLGEVNQYSKLYDRLKSTFIGKNDNWNSFLLNLDLEITTTILAESIDEYIKLGYHGIFFDNLDNFGIHGKQTAQKNSLLAFIKNMKSQYPNHLFIQNAGLEFIDFTYPLVDAVLVESVASHFDFSTSTYQLRSEEEFKVRLDTLDMIHNQYEIPVLLVEYANSQERYNCIQDRLEPSEIPYFVGTIDLQTKPNFNPIPSYAF